MLVKEIIEATGGILICGNEDQRIDNFSKDSRDIHPGDLYIPIVGEVFDGHRFIEDALNNGAIGTLTTHSIEPVKGKVIILVEDTKKALADMALYVRNTHDIKVVAITGSVGKTSTKDIIYSVVSQKYKALKSEGNYNNEIGLPLTLLRLQDEEVVVLEMGTARMGLISELSYIARPDICVITNIGTAHIGILGSRENILKAKLEITDYMQDDGVLIVNNDNDLLSKYALNHDVYTYGIENASDVQAANIQETSTGSIFEYEGTNIHIHVPGSHFVSNALAAIAVGNQLGIEVDKMKKGLEDFELTKKRMDFYFLKDQMILIDGSYNANVDSMKSSIDVLAKYEGKKIAILADMLELGDFSEQLHREVGKVLYEQKIDTVLCVGKEALYIADSASLNGLKDVHHFKTVEDLLKHVDEYLHPEEVILVKGSQGMKLSQVAKYIQDKYRKNPE